MTLSELENRLKEGLVVEIWYDPASNCREERFCCAVSRGANTEQRNGWGRSLKKAITAVLQEVHDETDAEK